MCVQTIKVKYFLMHGEKEMDCIDISKGLTDRARTANF